MQHPIELPDRLRERFAFLYRTLDNKFYFDDFNEKVLAPAARGIGWVFWRVGDATLIDGALVNGSARAVGWFSGILRHLQSGYLYHYAFAMFVGLALLVGWMLLAR